MDKEWEKRNGKTRCLGASLRLRHCQVAVAFLSASPRSAWQRFPNLERPYTGRGSCDCVIVICRQASDTALLPRPIYICATLQHQQTQARAPR